MRAADSAVGSDYAELLRQVKRAGLLNRRPWHAAGRIVLIVVLFAAGWTGFAVLGESWWQVAVAAFSRWCSPRSGFSAMTRDTGSSFDPAGPMT